MSQGAGKVTATSGGHAPILSVGGRPGGAGGGACQRLCPGQPSPDPPGPLRLT